ncbi:MAG: hypothetical protein KDD47_20730, partial [Acidobacteria bacterium]|nr:hypothetical protein [Acidobacteriota bacterium]
MLIQKYSASVPRLATSLLLTILAAGCGQEAQDSTAGALSGVEASTARGAADEGEGVFVSPKGRRIASGMVDTGGWVLPLDLERPKPKRPLGDRQSRQDILERRSRALTGSFPETRLGPDDGHTQNETSIDADGSVLVAGWNNYTDTGLVMGAGRSTDGGETWGFELFGGHTTMSDPAVAAGGGGKWYFGYL